MNPSTMPGMTYDDVANEYSKWRSADPLRSMSLAEYAKAQDDVEGAPKRQSAYGANWATQVSNFLGNASKGVARSDMFGGGPMGLPGTTPLATPQQMETPVATSGAAGAIRGVVPERFKDTAQHVVEGMPRTAMDVSAAMLAPGPGTALAAADAGLSGYAGAREAGAGQLASLGSGALGAGGMALAPGLESAGAGLAAKGLARTPLKSEVVQRLGEFLGGQSALAGGFTAQGAAQNALEGRDPREALTPENIFATLAGQAPFALMGARGVMERPSAITPEGDLVSYPSRTALEQVKRAESSSSLEADPTTRVLNQFMAGAMPAGPTEPEAYRPQASAAAKDFVSSLSPDEYAQLSPLGVTQPEPTDPLAKVAREKFMKAAFPDAVVPKATEPDFSLVNPLGADFSSTKQVTPALLLDRILAGEIVPTNSPDNTNNIALVDQLQRAYADEGAQQRGYVDMNHVSNTAELASLQQKGIGLTPAQQSAWNKLSPVEQQGAHVAAKVLNDPYGTLGQDPVKGGLDERRWQTQPIGPDTFARSIYQGASNMLAKWDRPITTVEDAAALVRDTNNFTKNVKDFLDQNGFGEGLQKQMTQEGLFDPITQDRLSEQYKSYLEDYLNNPSAEAASRSLQWVKNQVLLTARSAKETMLQSDKFQNPELGTPYAKGTQDEAQMEAAYMDARSKLPEPVQKILDQQYLKARTEREGGKSAQPTWALDDFRRGVVEAVNATPDEQMRALRDPTALGFSTTPGQKGVADSGEESLRLRAKPDARKATPDRTALDASKAEATLRAVNPKLADAVFNPSPSRVYDFSGRDMTDTGPAAEKKMTEVPDESADNEAAQRAENDKIAKYFTGVAGDPVSTINGMEPERLEAAFSGIFGDKAWKERAAKYAQLSGKTPNDVRKDGSAANWLKGFLTVDASGDLQQRRAWAEQNGFKDKDWADVQKVMLSADANKRLQWKARSMGLQPKEGALQELTAAKKAPGSTPGRINPQAKTDFLNFIVKDLLRRGYQPEVATTIGKFTERIADQFYWLDNVDFKELTDRQQVAQRFDKTMKVLGLSLPEQSIVKGQPVKNPIIAAMRDDLVKNGAYAPLNTFFKVGILGHEGFHLLQDKVFNNKDLVTNEDTQTVADSVNGMYKLAATLTPEQRAQGAHTLLELMVPPQYTRDASGKLLPEVQGFVNHVVGDPKEYSAFMYQMATMGTVAQMGREGDVNVNKVVRNNRDALNWFSQDVHAFMRGQFRYLGDMLDTLQKTLDDPDFRQSKGLSWTMGKGTTPPPLEEGDVVNRRTFTRNDNGQLTSTGDVPSLPRPDSERGKTTVPQPTTQGVGVTTRAMAEAALRVARSGPARLSGAAPGELVPEGGPNAFKTLSKVDPVWQWATSALKQLSSNLTGKNLDGTKTLDLTDVKAAKDFMASVGVPPGSGKPPFSNPFDALGEQTAAERKYSEGFIGRFLAPLQSRALNLKRQGISGFEEARQNMVNMRSNAHTIFQNIYGPLIKRVGALGKYGLDKQTNYYKFLHDGEGNFDQNANVAMSKILLKQQELGSVASNDPQLQKTIQDAIKGLPQDQALHAVSAVKDVNDVYATAGASLYKGAQEHQEHLAAYLSQSLAPRSGLSWKDHRAIGQAAVRAAGGDLASRGQLQQLVQSGTLTPAAFSAIEAVGMHGWDYLQQLKGFIRPGFASEQRFGRYQLFFKDPSGQNGSMAFKTMEEGKEFAAARAKEGYTDMRAVDKAELHNDQLFGSNPEQYTALRQLATTTYGKQIEAVKTLNPQLAQQLMTQEAFGRVLDNYSVPSALSKLQMERKLSPGREWINPVANMQEYASTVSNALARQKARDVHRLIRTDLEQQGLPKLSKDLETHFQNFMAPSNQAVTKMTTVGVAAYIGGDVARSVLDGTMGATIGLPVLMQEGVPVAKAHKYMMDGMTKVVNLYRDHAFGGQANADFNASAERGRALETTPIGMARTLTSNEKEDIVNYHLRRFNDENRLSRSPGLDTIDRDTESLNLEKAAKVGSFKPLSPTQLLTDGAYQLSKNLLELHGMIPNFGTKISGVAAINAAYDKGLRGEPLHNYAQTLLDNMNAGYGSSANNPVGYAMVSRGNPLMKGVVSFATMMQRYGLSQTAVLAYNARDAITGAKGLSTQQRAAAMKAAAYGIGTNWALAGTLGMTGVGVGFSLFNHVFHHDLEADARTKLSEFFQNALGADQEHGALLTDMAMNGLINQTTGLDVAGRTGVSSLFGIGPNQEPGIGSFLGPEFDMVKTYAEGLSNVMAGKPWLGAQDIAPHALSRLVELAGNYAQYGDLRLMDQNNNLLMQPSAAQAIGYAMGFKPARVREMRQEARLEQNSQDNFQITQEAKVNNYARQALQGDTQSAVQEAYSRMYEPGFNPREFLNTIVDRALDMQTQKDPMTKGSALNGQKLDEIGSTFDNPRASEVQRLQLKNQMVSQMGLPFGMTTSTNQEYLRAALVDQLRQQQGMGRQEALAWVKRYYGL